MLPYEFVAPGSLQRVVQNGVQFLTRLFSQGASLDVIFADTGGCRDQEQAIFHLLKVTFNFTSFSPSVAAGASEYCRYGCKL